MTDQPDPSTGDSKAESEESKTSSTKNLPIATDENTYSTYKKEPVKWTDKVVALATVAMTLATIAIGCLAYRQWVDSGALTTAAQNAATAAQQFKDSAADIQTKIALAQSNMQTLANSAQKSQLAIQDQFRLDQRPIIWLATPSTTRPETLDAKQIDLGHGPVLAIGIAYENFGKSPAYILWQKNGAAFGTNAINNIKMGENKPGKSFIPANGIVNFITIVSDPQMPEVITQWLKTDDEIAIRLAFRYTDSLGSPYETNMCWQHLATGAWRICEPSNTKDCSKEHCDKE